MGQDAFFLLLLVAVVTGANGISQFVPRKFKNSTTTYSGDRLVGVVMIVLAMMMLAKLAIMLGWLAIPGVK